VRHHPYTITCEILVQLIFIGLWLTRAQAGVAVLAEETPATKDLNYFFIIGGVNIEPLHEIHF
jgi:hypothetical protein